MRHPLHFEIRDITNPDNESRFEIELLDEPPDMGETIALGQWCTTWCASSGTSLQLRGRSDRRRTCAN